MSQMLGASNPFGSSAALIRNDQRLWPTWYNWQQIYFSRQFPFEDGTLWGRSRLIGDPAFPNIDLNFRPSYFETPFIEGGGQQMKKFQGFTRDSAGNLLASADVDLFLTTGDVFLRDVFSDAGGWFEITSEYSGQNHYILASKAGSPFLAGTTVQTLQPT